MKHNSGQRSSEVNPNKGNKNLVDFAKFIDAQQKKDMEVFTCIVFANKLWNTILYCQRWPNYSPQDICVSLIYNNE